MFPLSLITGGRFFSLYQERRNEQVTSDSTLNPTKSSKCCSERSIKGRSSYDRGYFNNGHSIERNSKQNMLVDECLSDKMRPKVLKLDNGNNSSCLDTQIKPSIDSQRKSDNSEVLKNKPVLHISTKQNNTSDTSQHQTASCQLTFKVKTKEVPGSGSQIELILEDFEEERLINQLKESLRDQVHAIQNDDTGTLKGSNSVQSSVAVSQQLAEDVTPTGSQSTETLRTADCAENKQECHFHENHPKFHTTESIVRESIKVYTCNHCQKRLPTEFEAKYHLLSYHNMTQMCEQCGCSIQTSSELLTHQFHDYCSYQHKQCTVCGKMYTDPTEMLKHVMDEHENRGSHMRKGRKCDQHRSRTWRKKQQIMTEEQKHALNVMRQKRIQERKQKIALTNEKPFQCDKCGAQLKTLSSLQHHQMLHDQPKTCLCKYCGKGFKTKYYQRVHERNHERPYPCPHCSKSFAQLQYYKLHVAAHKGIKKFNCQICGKGFFTKGYFKLHQYVHENGGRKPYSCQECGSGFMTVHALRKHMIKHGGDKQFKCSYCSLRFYFEYDAQKHMLKHTRPKMCDICGKSYPSEFKLKRHKTQVHKIQFEKNVFNGIQFVSTP